MAGIQGANPNQIPLNDVNPSKPTGAHNDGDIMEAQVDEARQSVKDAIQQSISTSIGLIVK